MIIDSILSKKMLRGIEKDMANDPEIGSIARIWSLFRGYNGASFPMVWSLFSGAAEHLFKVSGILFSLARAHTFYYIITNEGVPKQIHPRVNSLQKIC